MEQIDLEILSGFDAVWQRVQAETHTAQPEEPEQPVQLEEIMESLHYAWEGYSQLACRSSGSVRCRLRELAGETKCAFRELQLEYFLQTGEFYHPENTVFFASCTLSNLRKLWNNASVLMQKLQRAQQDAGNLCTEKFQALEKDMAWQKDRLRCIMAGLIQ